MYPIFALLQIFDGDNIYLVDVTQIKQSNGFSAICVDPTITKIMHAGREDIEVLWHSWNCQINNYFDTQIAYAFLEDNLSIGYAALVNEVCGVSLDKEQTQSDWLARPLSSKQLAYAANDVAYLYKVYSHLFEQIKTKPYINIVKQEMKEVSEWILTAEFDDASYREAKDVSRLNGEQLVLFKRLFYWRETIAKQENRTRNHIVKDHQLVDICEREPQSITQLKGIADIHPRAIRVYGNLILEQIKFYQEQSEPSLKPVVNPRDVVALKSLNQVFANVVKHKAKALGIQKAVLMSQRVIKKTALALLTDEKLPKPLLGWRGDVLLNDFQQIINDL